MFCTSTGPRARLYALLVVALTCASTHASAQSDPTDAPPETPAPVVATGEAPTWDELVDAALRTNPTLDALAARHDAALSRAEAAGSIWPQPRLSVQAGVLPVETRQGPQYAVVGVQQAIPSLDRRREADDPHVAEARGLALAWESEVLRTVHDVEVAWIQLARLDAIADLVREQQAVIRDVATHESAVLAFGGAEHVDLLRTSLLDVVLEDRLEAIADARDEVVATLAPRTALPEAALHALRPALPSPLVPCASVDDLVATAVARHPDPRRAEARGDGALEAAELARLAVREPIQASIAWGTIGRYDTPMPGTGNGGRDTLMVGVSVPLPVARRASVADAQAHEATAAGALDDAAALRLQLASEIRGACTRIDAAQERIERYERDLLPMARDIVDHYAIDLAVDGADHTEWLLAVEQVLSMREAVVEARASAALADALLAARRARGDVPTPPADAPGAP